MSKQLKIYKTPTHQTVRHYNHNHGGGVQGRKKTTHGTRNNHSNGRKRKNRGGEGSKARRKEIRMGKTIEYNRKKEYETETERPIGPLN